MAPKITKEQTPTKYFQANETYSENIVKNTMARNVPANPNSVIFSTNFLYLTKILLFGFDSLLFLELLSTVI